MGWTQHVVTLALLGGSAPALEPSPVAASTHDPDAHARQSAAVVEFVARGQLPRQRAAQQRVTVQVDAKGATGQPNLEAWPGDVIFVTPLRGQWTVDQRSIKPVGPQGHLTELDLHQNWGHLREVTTLPFGRLLLRVGGGPWVDALGGAAVRTLRSGPVELRINDNASSLADNAGMVEVEVVVERRSPPEARACAEAKTALQDHIAGLATACRSHVDCGMVFGFNPCSQQVAVRAVTTEHAQDVLDGVRRKAWKACGFVMPPCTTQAITAHCEASRCVAAGPSQPQIPTPPRPAPGCQGMVCGAGQRCKMHQVHCASAPCPAMPMCAPL